MKGESQDPTTFTNDRADPSVLEDPTDNPLPDVSAFAAIFSTLPDVMIRVFVLVRADWC